MRPCDANEEGNGDESNEAGKSKNGDEGQTQGKGDEGRQVQAHEESSAETIVEANATNES